MVFPSPEKVKYRFMKRCGVLGVQDDESAAVPDEMLGNGCSFPNCVLMIFLSICFI